MRWLITNDLHQMGQKWKFLVQAVKAEKPEWIFVTGDILPKEQFLFENQQKFFKSLSKYLAQMRELGVSKFFTYLGNDDLHPLEPELDFLGDKKLCFNMNQQVLSCLPYVVAGMNKVRDYPFGYKHWCHPDADRVVDPVQFTDPVTVAQNGEWMPIPDLNAYLSAKPKIGDLLEDLVKRINPQDMANSVWMIHQPPSLCGMDICSHGQEVGSPTILTFIEHWQPLVTMHGHIHESPYQPGGRWHKLVGRTHVVQPGQLGSKLHYVVADVEDGVVKKLAWHHSRLLEPEIMEF